MFKNQQRKGSYLHISTSFVEMRFVIILLLVITYVYRISCDTGVTWKSYDIVNHTEFHMDGFYTEMSDTASIAT